MAITFPRTLPDIRRAVAGTSLTLDSMSELTPLRSGKKIAADLGPDLWRGQWSPATSDSARFEEFRSWYLTLMSREAFYGYDFLRQYPRAYGAGWGGLTVGGNPFDGTCTLADVAVGSVEIDLSDLPVGFVLSVGDYLAFDYGTDSRALHKVAVGGTADVNGDVTVEVRPSVRIGWAADATVYLHRAAAMMLIVPRSWSEQSDPPRRWRGSFQAIQTL